MRALLVPAILSVLAAAAAAAPREVDIRSDRAPDSYFLAVIGRAGLLSGLGHRHAVLASSWTATGRCDPDALSSCRLEIVVPAASLEIDTERADALAGLKGRRPSAGDRKKIAADLRRLLDVERHPTIRFAVENVQESASDGTTKLQITGKLSIKDKTGVEKGAAELSRGGGALEAKGIARFKLTDYGITPPSVAGVVKVADEVELRFRLRLPVD